MDGSDALKIHPSYLTIRAIELSMFRKLGQYLEN
jgi:hypothetical protein